MNEKEENDEETDDAAAKEQMLESNEVTSKEDMEIRRLIDERRTTPKEEKQRLKEVSKQILKNASGRKNEKTGKRFNEYSKTSQESNLLKDDCSSPTSRMRKEKSSRHGKELPTSLEKQIV